LTIMLMLMMSVTAGVVALVCPVPAPAIAIASTPLLLLAFQALATRVAIQVEESSCNSVMRDAIEVCADEVIKQTPG
jgi:hypothetical protein